MIFRKYYVAKDKIKVRVSYSLDKRIDGRKCVTLYAKDYGKTLGYLFPEEYTNDSDIQTDYSDKGKVNLFEDHPLYQAARDSYKFYRK